MLKTLDDLEKAIGRMMDKARSKAPDGSGSKSAQSSVDQVFKDRPAGSSEQTSEEAAEFIRRAIKRLKSL